MGGKTFSRDNSAGNYMCSVLTKIFSKKRVEGTRGKFVMRIGLPVDPANYPNQIIHIFKEQETKSLNKYTSIYKY